MKGLRLGVTPFRLKEGAGQRLFPNARLVVVKSPRDFFKGKVKDVDAMLYTAQTATAWTLIYPDWTVVVPKGLKYECPMAFALPHDQVEWTWYVNTWLETAVKSGLTKTAYDYWILGKREKNKGKRWSIAKDVLGWIK